MRRYECTEGTARKFWEISLLGTTVAVRYGRIGGRGRGQRWDFDSPDEAKRDWEKRISKKIGRGYQLTHIGDRVGEGGAPTAAAAMARNEALEQAIIERPDDDDAILVYGDWLAERGDPRGQVILTYRNMHEERDPARFVALKTHAQALIGSHPAAFHGPLLEHADRVRIRWRLGFFDDVRINQRSDPPGADATLDALLAAPAALLLRTLTIEDFTMAAAARLMRAHAPTLRALELHVPESFLAPADLRDLAPLFDLLVAPGLTRLSIHEPPDGDWLLQALATAPIAGQLTHIAITNTDLYQGTAELLVERFPRLRSFDLEHCGLDDEQLEELRARLASAPG